MFSSCTIRKLTALVLLVVSVTHTVSADDKPDKTVPKGPRYTTRKIHDRNGIGKFYFGREIAQVMGYQGASWLERTSRQREENLTLLVKSLKIKPDMTIADIGAGSGVISFLMANELGKDGKVMAVDIQPQMIARLKKRAKAGGITNVHTVRGSTKATNLKPGTIDLAIMVDVYHEFAFPYEMISDLSKALKPGGRVAFVEYRMEDPTVPIKLVHKMSEAQVKREISQAEFGLKWQETVKALPWQHVVVFEKLPENAKPTAKTE